MFLDTIVPLKCFATNCTYLRTLSNMGRFVVLESRVYANVHLSFQLNRPVSATSLTWPITADLSRAYTDTQVYTY